eukprot:15269090-Heterocapsa_arctica.AAC.1
MHPIPQHICNSKAYVRRSESEQSICEHTTKVHLEEQQRQTNFDDGVSGQNYCEQEEFIGLTEDKNTQRDCTAGDRPTNK